MPLPLDPDKQTRLDQLTPGHAPLCLNQRFATGSLDRSQNHEITAKLDIPIKKTYRGLPAVG